MFAPTLGTTSHIEPNGRGFGTPTNNLNVHGLGVIRTLILLDGNRVPGTFYDTTVNVDMLPQMLVQRVDVVTGGASAVYGSDAVGGVVNYVLDHNSWASRPRRRSARLLMVTQTPSASVSRRVSTCSTKAISRSARNISAATCARCGGAPHGDPAHSR
jgi:outer membrane cobalamin receptor